ncbi:MAG TPA: DUF4337 domain-containing protein [Polyangia bacterium]|jgi:hypothetical protein|nr:DUF4337 domain-containing protein [Polyangia bacterium]
MSELADAISESIEKSRESRLNAIVALSVAVTATITALCNVKDGNIVQAMAQAQASAVDTWAYYQAKGTKQIVAESAHDQLEIQRDLTPNLGADARAAIARKLEDYAQKIAHYEKDKAEIKKTAEGHQEEYDRLNERDDQFDMAEATLSIAIALFGVTALTQKRALLVTAMVFATIGVFWGVCGFGSLRVHPAFLAWLLG